MKKFTQVKSHLCELIIGLSPQIVEAICLGAEAFDLKNPLPANKAIDEFNRQQTKELNRNKVHQAKAEHPGWTQQQIADDAGLERSTVSKHVNESGILPLPITLTVEQECRELKLSDRTVRDIRKLREQHPELHARVESKEHGGDRRSEQAKDQANNVTLVRVSAPHRSFSHCAGRHSDIVTMSRAVSAPARSFSHWGYGNEKPEIGPSAGKIDKVGHKELPIGIPSTSHGR